MGSSENNSENNKTKFSNDTQTDMVETWQEIFFKCPLVAHLGFISPLITATKLPAIVITFYSSPFGFNSLQFLLQNALDNNLSFYSEELM